MLFLSSIYVSRPFVIDELKIKISKTNGKRMLKVKFMIYKLVGIYCLRFINFSFLFAVT